MEPVKRKRGRPRKNPSLELIKPTPKKTPKSKLDKASVKHPVGQGEQTSSYNGLLGKRRGRPPSKQPDQKVVKPNSVEKTKMEKANEEYVAKQAEQMKRYNAVKPKKVRNNSELLLQKLAEECKESFEAASSKVSSDIQNMGNSIYSQMQSIKESVNSPNRSTILIVKSETLYGNPIERTFKAPKGKESFEGTVSLKNEKGFDAKASSTSADSGLRNEGNLFRGCKTSTAIENETPKVLKKFRPPMPKYLQRELEASKGSSTVTSAEAEIDPLIKTEPADVVQPLLKVEPGHKEAYLDVALLPAEGPTVDKWLYREPESIKDQPPTAKFDLINKWMARKKPNHCTKLHHSLTKMLTKESLISTYKCMVKCCSYSSISTKNFEKHLLCHEENQSKEFLNYCPYCFFIGESTPSLLQHYQEIHKHDKYQCGYCFFRCTDDQSCWEHVSKHHVKQSQSIQNIIYECPLETAPENEMLKLRLFQKRAQNVMPLLCLSKFNIYKTQTFSTIYYPTACDLKFYAMTAFVNHFKEHMDNQGAWKNTKAAEDYRVYQKKRSNNEIGEFECLFCEFASKSRGESLYLASNHFKILNCQQMSYAHTCKTIRKSSASSARGIVSSRRLIHHPLNPLS